MEPNNQEFLRDLHEEKIRTQTERADYITKKLAFVTVPQSSEEYEFRVLFASWQVISMTTIVALWVRHRNIIWHISEYGSENWGLGQKLLLPSKAIAYS